MDRGDVLAQLRSALPQDALIVDPDITRSLGHDEAEWAPVGEALGLIRATSSDQVATTVRICAQFGVPVTARGAGTGLSGGANAIDGGVIIALDRLNQIRLIDPLERLAVVQAGVINDELRTVAAQYGLWYPPDPASSPWSTIGGNIATNAGGVCCVKYGVTKDYVLALEVVTGTGELVRLGRVTAKGVAGYDLVGLLVGSEGTLGIVTEATVRLKPLPAPPRTIVGYFSSIVDAGEAARAVAEAGIIPSAWSWSTGTAWLRSTNGRTWGFPSRPMWFCLAESMIRASQAMIAPIRCWPASRRLAPRGQHARPMMRRRRHSSPPVGSRTQRSSGWARC
jgi:glycolate oxidase